MYILELAVKCPSCESVTKLLTKQADPVIFTCGGCGDSIIIQGEGVYTLKSKFIKRLIKKYKVSPIGQLLITDVSDTAKNMVTDSKIKVLQEILKENCDVNEFIKLL